MPEQITDWLLAHSTELAGAVLSLFYICFSIRQNILTWITGLLASLFYIVVFFEAKFYADMGLQGYYVFISIYGWYFWMKGSVKNEGKQAKVSRLSVKLIPKLLVATLGIYAVILFILLKYTDSPVPFMDSTTTALSIVATWMLARKIIEHWLIWVFVDLFSAGLYIYKSLWPTAVLFVVYTIMAVLGYYEWRKSLKGNAG